MFKKSLFSILCLLLLLASARGKSIAVLDLSKHDFSQNNYLLDAKWEFYPHQFLGPKDFLRNNLPPPLLVPPTSWNNIHVNDKKFGSSGFATYRITLVHLPKKALMLNAFSVQTACKIYFNQTLMSEVGKVGHTYEVAKPMNRDVQLNLPPALDTLQIIVHISNFHHRKGGFVQPFEIGLTENILAQQTLFYILDATESSALFIIGLFLLAVFIFRRKDMAALYFALFCITLSLRPVISVNYLLGYLIPTISWSMMLKLEYLGMVFPCLFMTLFIKKMFPLQLSTLLVQSLTLIFLLEATLVIICPPAVFSWLVPLQLILIPVGVLILSITIVKAVLSNVEGAKYAGFGVIVLLFSLLLKVLTYVGILPSLHVLITLLDVAFIFMMSLILGSRFSLQFVKAEILQEKTEQQHRELEIKSKEVEKQKHILQDKNKEILDSIQYARRLQHAILPSEKSVQAFFPNSFILYQPKDIVAGDFYWMEHKTLEEFTYAYFAVCDCTGHGVPGAFVSVVCHNALNRALHEFDLLNPSDILNKTRELVIAEFEKSGEEVKDGMDISLLSIKLKGNVQSQKVNNAFQNMGNPLPDISNAYSYKQVAGVSWSGANNPLIIIRPKTTLIEVRPDKQPIGKYANAKPFTNHELDYFPGDTYYLFTDGYADQFGGETGKKFKFSNFQKLLGEVAELELMSQKNELHKRIENWRGELEQLDDICVAGLRIH